MKGKKTGGRKSGTRNKSTVDVRDLLDNEVDFKVVVGKLYELTQGVEVEKETLEGDIVYSKPPDPVAAKILMEYRFGKAPQSVDVTSKGESLNIKMNVIKLANGDTISI